MSVTNDQISFFKDNGYLIIRDFLSLQEVQNLQTWAQEVHDWKPTTESEFMPYEVCQRMHGSEPNINSSVFSLPS
jgi:hypothetical protein